MRDNYGYEDSPARERDASLHRLGRLTWRTTQLGALASVGFAVLFARSAPAQTVTLAIRLSRRSAGGAWLVVADDGPGFPPGGPVRRGVSGGGSTGLGLDIARRIAEESGGTMTIGRSATGGGCVTLEFGAPTGPPGGRRHRRAGLLRG